MAKIAFIDLAKLLDEAGFPGGTSQANGIAVIAAESLRDPSISNTTGNDPPSVDRGLWQINSYWHAEVSDECAYDPVCATKEAFRISSGGTDYGAWSAFKNGSYQGHLEAAKVALNGWSRIKSLQDALRGLSTQLSLSQKDIDALGDKVGSLQAQVLSKDAMIDKLTAEKATLTKQNQDLQAENTRVIQTNNDLLARALSYVAEVKSKLLP